MVSPIATLGDSVVMRHPGPVTFHLHVKLVCVRVGPRRRIDVERRGETEEVGASHPGALPGRSQVQDEVRPVRFVVVIQTQSAQRPPVAVVVLQGPILEAGPQESFPPPFPHDVFASCTKTDRCLPLQIVPEVRLVGITAAGHAPPGVVTVLKNPFMASAFARVAPSGACEVVKCGGTEMRRARVDPMGHEPSVERQTFPHQHFHI